MQYIDLLTPQYRIALLLASMAVLWLVEFGFPLQKKDRSIIPNLLLTLFAVAIYSGFGWVIAAISVWTHQVQFGLFQIWKINPWLVLVSSILLLDFWAAYVVHRVMHAYSPLWSFHRVHHLDVMVDVTTSLRQHPFESLMRIAFLLTGVLLLGIPAWMVVVYQTLSTINALLEHANIKLPSTIDRFLGYLIVTPNLHKLHHSALQPETDSNFGNIFSVWDRIFLTFRKRESYREVKFGLDNIEKAEDLGATQLLMLPFRDTSIFANQVPGTDQAKKKTIL